MSKPMSKEVEQCMNGMYEELIEKLRKNNRMSGWTHIDRLMDDAIKAIEALQQENEQLQELAQAKAEGRLVVLSTPMIPLVESDDPMDSDVYCPACGVSVSGGWPDYHPDLEWKMCQCPHCGQSIDDTKTITREAAEKALGGVSDGN